MDVNVKTKRNIQQFNGERYSVWKFRIKSLLSELQVLDVIENEIPNEPDENWKKRNLIAKSAIVEYLSDSFLNYAQDNDHAKTIITSLDDIYERRSLVSQLALRKQLLELKLKPSNSLLQHFAFFDGIITELISAGAKLDEMDKVSHLLLTLPNSYDGMITALETLGEDNLNLAFVKTRLLDQEVKLKSESITELKILNINKESVQGTSGINNKKHLKYKKHPRKKFSRHPTNSSIYKLSNLMCDHCGRRNHVRRDCFYFKQMMTKQRERTTTIQHVQTNNDEQGSFAFMLSNLTASKHQKVSDNFSISFLLDSGATDHIVNRIDVFNSYLELTTPLKIGVAKNGMSVLATGKGSMKVTTNLGVMGTLDNVLFSPDVPYNLLSVDRIQKAGMTVIFDKDGVRVIKDDQILLTGDQLADAFTKILPSTKFSVIRLQLNLE